MRFPTAVSTNRMECESDATMTDGSSIPAKVDKADLNVGSIRHFSRSCSRSSSIPLFSVPLLPAPPTDCGILSTEYSNSPSGSIHDASTMDENSEMDHVGDGRTKPRSWNDRIQRSRERNRIHARKTRQRKKEQMQTLQGRAEELKEEQIRLKQIINEKHTADILIGLFSKESRAVNDTSSVLVDGQEGSAAIDDDPRIEEILKRSVEEIPDASKVTELPALILPGHHASKKLKESSADSRHSEDIHEDGIDYELLGKDRSKCTPEELDRIRRERNRMHAKRTRDRKRLFMEEISEICRKLEEENQLLREHLEKSGCSASLVNAPVRSTTAEPESVKSGPRLPPAQVSPISSRIEPLSCPETCSSLNTSHLEHCSSVSSNHLTKARPITRETGVIFDHMRLLLEAAGSFDKQAESGEEKRQTVIQTICTAISTSSDTSTSVCEESHSDATVDAPVSAKRRRLNDGVPYSITTTTVGC